MSRLVAVVLVVACVLAPIGPVAAGVATDLPHSAAAGHGALDTGQSVVDTRLDTVHRQNGANATDGPRIAAVYPNPVADGDRGEFVRLAVPPDTDLGAYRLADEQGSVSLPNVTASGRVAVAWDPALARNLTDDRVVSVDGSLGLANGGERLRLRRGAERVASARYREAPEGELGRFDADGTITWRSLGRSNRSVVTATGGTARAFVLPDAPAVPLETIRNADDRILLAGYTFASERVAQSLEAAAARGVEVRVLLDGAPVDGITRREARLLDSLVDGDVEVRLLGGPRGRYAFHHPKYAVVDDRAVVLTENWKPAGTGGRSSRGWGVVVSQPPIVDGLAETFRTDAAWIGATPWRTYKQGRTFEASDVANGSYEQRHAPEDVPVERTELLVTPDNGPDRIVSVVDGATESVDVVQMSIDGPDQQFLRAAVRAARRGVDVRILLSSAWYAREDNRRLVDHLRDRAENEDLPLEARLAEPGGRYEKIHAKGMVVDGDQVLVGSLNWNDESVRENREVMVLLEGTEVGRYYQQVFDADWDGGESGLPGSSLPVGSLVAVGGAIVVAVLVLRRVEFGADVGVDP